MIGTFIGCFLITFVTMALYDFAGSCEETMKEVRSSNAPALFS